MNDRMTLERFQDLADAYGGVILRWPERWREEAARVALQPATAAVLARAIALDDELDAWTLPAVPESLRARMLAGAPVPRQILAGRARLWWSGVGIAAALAGAAAGAVAVAVISPVDVPAESSTSFGYIGPAES